MNVVQIKASMSQLGEGSCLAPQLILSQKDLGMFRGDALAGPSIALHWLCRAVSLLFL